MVLLKGQIIKKPNLDVIPQELKEHPKWMMWKALPNKKKPDELTKTPVNLKGYAAGKDDPRNWITFNQAKAAFLTGKFDGVGVVIDESDDLICVDLDGLGDLNHLSLEIKDYTIEGYTEKSPSGGGLHIWVKGQKPAWMGTKQNGVEVYGNSCSFLTITGDAYHDFDLPIKENQEFINQIAEKYFKKNVATGRNEKHYNVESDDAVLNKMFQSKHGKKIEELFNGNHAGYSSQSESDLALCNHLAYWTNCNPEQMDRLFRKSGLYREKWDEKRRHGTYGQITIDESIAAIFIKNQVEPDADYVEIEKPNWWIENPNGTTSLNHVPLGQYIIKKYHVVHYPDVHSDLYFYNKETGLYEQDKTGRCIKSFIRNEHGFKAGQVKEVMEYINDKAPTVKETSRHYFAVNNGLLHVDTMEFKEFTPDEFLIKKVPTNYNPGAFDDFVDDTLKRVTDNYEPSIRNLEEMMGCVLYPKLLVPKMWYLYGMTAHNGKSTILYMIQKTFNYHGGNISSVTPRKLAENNFAGAAMYGKMANVVDDLEDVLIQDAGTLKSIITGGYVEIEKKNKDSESVEMNLTMIAASNHFPDFKEYGNQINKRLHIIPFEHDFSQDHECVEINETYERLSNENAREYVLKLAVDAVKRMLVSTEKENITCNEKADAAKKDFADSNEPLKDFLFEFDRQYFEDNKGTETFKNYIRWCDDNCISYRMSLKKFKVAICNHYGMVWGDKKIKATHASGWLSVVGFRTK